MTRNLFLLLFAVTVFSCNAQNQTESQERSAEVKTGQGPYIGLEGEKLGPVHLSESEWKERLSPEAFRILRQAGTERAFSGAYWDNKKEGVYTCGGCGLPLFSSSTKYRSGFGWPSFWEPIRSEHVKLDTDYKLGYARTEVLCGRCGGHQGHVFEDGPEPTGLRYCINSVSLDFVERPTN